MASTRPCPICDHQHTRFLFQPKRSPGPVVRCLNCGMVYVENIEDAHALIFDGPAIRGNLDPKILTSANLSDISGSSIFRQLPDTQAEWPALQRNATDALQRIERIIKINLAQGRILDVGSGFGFFLAVAKERGWDAYGLEPLAASAVYARATYGLNIITDTLHQTTFPSDFFDVITSFQVFEHLPFPKADLQLLNKMLRKDGIILIEVPNFDTWTMRMMKSRHRHFVHDHINFFSIHTLRNLLVDCGFEVLDQYHPTRHITVRRLVRYWFSRYLPASIVGNLERALQKTRLWQQTIDLNIGDIIAVIGCKSQ